MSALDPRQRVRSSLALSEQRYASGNGMLSDVTHARSRAARSLRQEGAGEIDACVRIADQNGMPSAAQDRSCLRVT